jgi:hypothetical protein
MLIGVRRSNNQHLSIKESQRDADVPLESSMFLKFSTISTGTTTTSQYIYNYDVVGL